MTTESKVSDGLRLTHKVTAALARSDRERLLDALNELSGLRLEPRARWCVTQLEWVLCERPDERVMDE